MISVTCIFQNTVLFLTLQVRSYRLYLNSCVLHCHLQGAVIEPIWKPRLRQKFYLFLFIVWDMQNLFSVSWLEYSSRTVSLLCKTVVIFSLPRKGQCGSSSHFVNILVPRSRKTRGCLQPNFRPIKCQLLSIYCQTLIIPHSIAESYISDASFDRDTKAHFGRSFRYAKLADRSGCRCRSG